MIKRTGMKKMIGSRKRGAPMPKSMAAPKAMKAGAMEGQTPPMQPPNMGGPPSPMIPGMKKGGAVKKMAKGGKVAKPGIGLMIVLGKKGK